MVSVFVNGKLNTTQPFYIGKDPFAAGQGQKVIFTGADSLVLYTLSPGGVSEFADIRLCAKEKCAGYDKLENGALFTIRSSCSKMLLLTLIIYMSMLHLDSLVDLLNGKKEEMRDMRSDQIGKQSVECADN